MGYSRVIAVATSDIVTAPAEGVKSAAGYRGVGDTTALTSFKKSGAIIGISVANATAGVLSIMSLATAVPTKLMDIEVPSLGVLPTAVNIGVRDGWGLASDATMDGDVTVVTA
jgi:hypothetical protein